MIPDCNEIIEERLWVGRYILPDHLEFLDRLGIRAVVNLQSEQDLEQYQISLERLLQFYGRAGIEIRHIPINDFDQNALSANLPAAVRVLEELMDPPGSRVYIHCTAGINRGPTLAAAYLIKARGFSFREAYELLKKQRRCEPFLCVLEEYESFLKCGKEAY